jgi:CheY-like chemotaxis protein
VNGAGSAAGLRWYPWPAGAVALESDVVIMDWHMPDLDGLAATAAIRDRRPGVDVIAYSATDDGDVAERFRRWSLHVHRQD